MGTGFLLGVTKNLFELIMIPIGVCEHGWLPRFCAVAKRQFKPQGTGTNSALGGQGRCQTEVTLEVTHKG